MTKSKIKIGIIGAGAWGTALALLLSKKGYEIILWFADKEALALAEETRENQVYLPGFPLDEIKLTDSLPEACSDQEYLVLASPTQYSRKVLKEMAPSVLPSAILINTSKGIEVTSGKLMSQVIVEELPKHQDKICFLSGPSFADEVAAGKKTIITVASQDPKIAKQVQELFKIKDFRVYTSQDIIGVQLGGALKNILAIASGLLAGKNFGQNIQGALVARGLKEIIDYGQILGADPDTFGGLSGWGDLYITLANPDKSRNSGFGKKLGQGSNVADLISNQKQIVEGYHTTKAVYDSLQIFKKENQEIEMPITEKLYGILYNNESIDEALEDLFGREPKAENGD